MIIARKGQSLPLDLGFDKLEFHHLAGLHKLKDLRISRADRKSVFESILSGKIADAEIMRSRYYKSIECRLRMFNLIEKLLDDNRLVFRFIKRPSQFSAMQAEFLLSTPHSDGDVYIFLDKKDDTGLYFCRSIFAKEGVDYTVGQPRYTLLYKEKVSMDSGACLVQYDRRCS